LVAPRCRPLSETVSVGAGALGETGGSEVVSGFVLFVRFWLWLGIGSWLAGAGLEVCTDGSAERSFRSGASDETTDAGCAR
jgi:hypothetical protein